MAHSGQELALGPTGDLSGFFCRLREKIESGFDFVRAAGAYAAERIARLRL